jgi:mannose/fructose/N-acetylgalactosamine-specific phosphotransferase system component IID
VVTPQESGLGSGLKLRVWLWSLTLQGSWNPQRMQNLGLLTILLGWLRGERRHTEQDRLFCRRYYEFFNTNPYLANFLIGGLLRLECHRRGGGDVPSGFARTFRDSLGRALASIGDQLFWMGLRPALVMAACLCGLLGSGTAALVVFAAFAAGQLVLRWVSLERGYRLGMDIVDVLTDRRWHQAIALVHRAGMTLTGMVAGVYLTRVQDVAASQDIGMLLVGSLAGLGLPLVVRRRLPGEILVLVALALALGLSFAIPRPGG